MLGVRHGCGQGEEGLMVYPGAGQGSPNRREVEASGQGQGDTPKQTRTPVTLASFWHVKQPKAKQIIFFFLVQHTIARKSRP